MYCHGFYYLELGTFELKIQTRTTLCTWGTFISHCHCLHYTNYAGIL